MDSVTQHTVLVRDAVGKPERLRRTYYRFQSGRGSNALSYRGCADSVTIGSHPANQLVLPQPTISRFHARLELDEIGYRLVDLDSTNGTFVAGLRIGSAYIVHKSRLRFGDVEVTFEVERDVAELGLAEGERWGEVLGRTAVMRRVFDLLGQVAPTASTLLLSGETGVGKDMLASEVHRRSGRTGELVVVDCASIPEMLVESELFGHEKGAFTGADTSRVGAFEQAHGGTLFLDEIGELPLAAQVKLLRAIEQRQVKRVGSDVWHKADIRLIAATHRDLARMCNQRLFREDLYYRISVVSVRIPPLRERREDIPLLIQAFADAAGVLAPFDAGQVDELMAQPWPGNVRELRNAVERAIALGGGSWTPPQDRAATEEPYKVAKARAVEAFERSYLTSLLDRHHGNVAQAARAAGIDSAWIFRLAKRYEMDLTTFRSRR